MALPSTGKMFRDLLAILERFTGPELFETAMEKRTKGIIFMLRLPDMLQPFIFSSKCSGL